MTEARVLGFQGGSGDRQGLLDRMWGRVAAAGWVPDHAARVVIVVGQGHRGPLITATARSLARFLTVSRPGITVETVELEAGEESCSGRRLEFGPEGAVRIRGVAMSRGVRIPSFWFESVFLVTICGVGPDPLFRLGAVLQAQSEILHLLGNRGRPAALAYEAHRLGGSDLAVACGSVDRRRPDSEAWWVLGPRDVDVERAVAAAAGVEAEDLPLLREIARHEELEPTPGTVSAVPAIQGYVAARWLSTPRRVWAELTSFVHAAADEARALEYGVKRIPHAVRRRVIPRLRRLRAG